MALCSITLIYIYTLILFASGKVFFFYYNLHMTLCSSNSYVIFSSNLSCTYLILFFFC
ncbi:hypothetical protein AB4K20DRAFT_1894347 [Rhizopus microsporus]